MGRLIIHSHPDVEKNHLERAKKFLQLSAEAKVRSLFSLIQLSVLLNNGQPLKKPKGKGLIITKAE